MEQEHSENNIKSFKCPIHASENIQRVSLELNADSSLKCLECILTHPDQNSKDFMIPFNDFIDQAAKHYEKFRSFKEPAPPLLIEALSQKDLSIEILTHHIEQEKQKVENAFNTILQEFTQLCHSTKEDIFRQLDNQIVFSSSNYKYFKSTLDRYFNPPGAEKKKSFFIFFLLKRGMHPEKIFLIFFIRTLSLMRRKSEREIREKIPERKLLKFLKNFLVGKIFKKKEKKNLILKKKLL